MRFRGSSRLEEVFSIFLFRDFAPLTGGTAHPPPSSWVPVQLRTRHHLPSPSRQPCLGEDSRPAMWPCWTRPPSKTTLFGFFHPYTLSYQRMALAKHFAVQRGFVDSGLSASSVATGLLKYLHTNLQDVGIRFYGKLTRNKSTLAEVRHYLKVFHMKSSWASGMLWLVQSLVGLEGLIRK